MTDEKAQEITVYKTSDMKCAAALLACGHDLVDLENHGLPKGRGRELPGGRKQTSKIRFVFEYSEQLHQDLVDYTSGSLRLSVKAAFTNLDLVKSLIANANFETVDKINRTVARENA